MNAETRAMFYIFAVYTQQNTIAVLGSAELSVAFIYVVEWGWIGSAIAEHIHTLSTIE